MAGGSSRAAARAGRTPPGTGSLALSIVELQWAANLLGPAGGPGRLGLRVPAASLPGPLQPRLPRCPGQALEAEGGGQEPGVADGVVEDVGGRGDGVRVRPPEGHLYVPHAVKDARRIGGVLWGGMRE